MVEHNFDKVKWAEMDRLNQLGNIGSEVGRALKAKRQNKIERSQAAFYRGLDLIDETARIWAERRQSGLRELLNAREQFAEAMLSEEIDTTIEDYFMQYAIAARSRL